MARPPKEGLDYFPLDVDIDQDDKLTVPIARYGMEGFGIIIKLMTEVYKHGYYYPWTEKEQYIFSSKTNVPFEKVNEVVNECIKWGFFNQKLYELHHILTSYGFQKRYLLASNRRKDVIILPEYTLKKEEKTSEKQLMQTETKLMQTETKLMSAKSTQKKRKEIKEEEIKDYIRFDDMPHVRITHDEFDKLVELMGDKEQVTNYLYNFAAWILTQPKKKQETSSAYLSVRNWYKRDSNKSIRNNSGNYTKRDVEIENRRRDEELHERQLNESIPPLF